MKKSPPLLALLALLPAGLAAHDTWLQPVASRVAAGKPVQLALTSAMSFKGLEFGIPAWRVRQAFGRVGDERFFLTVGATTDHSLAFTAQPPRSGVVMLCVELKPKLLELEPELIEVYLEEIHAAPETRAQWLAVPAPRRWRENYVKLTKTYVRVGEPAAGDRAWAEPAGLALEIVPEQDPTALRAGDKFSVRVLRSGLPLAGLPLGFVCDGEKAQHVVVTDAAGRAAAPLDHPGRWLVHGTHLRRSAEPDLEWESDFVTLVVDAAPAR
ncbi:MAG: DUF4198 domain-containing protein [Opitutae bacterium]|nr:DUF4198 domain-containing protein [Opitutae bacterium]